LIRIDPKTVHPLHHAAIHFTDNIALISENLTLSYSEIFQQALSISDYFEQRGLKTGEIIVLDDLTPKNLILFFWACTLGGYIAFPINTRFPDDALAEIIRGINPALVITSRSLFFKMAITPNELLNISANLDSREMQSFNPDSSASLLMTSGSAGSAKLVQHSLMNHIASALGSNQNIKLNPGDRWLLTLPLYHVGGLAILFRSVLAGSAVVIANDSQSLLQNISAYQISHLSLVATQLQRIVGETDSPQILTSLRVLLLGGSAMPQALLQTALNMNLPIHVSYGSTEMASQITTTTVTHRSDSLTHSGEVLPGRDLIISHEGEILVKGSTLAQGYRVGSALTSITDLEGWFHTGDVGYINVQGALTVTGRLDNQFISGGENIQPEHIERALEKLPGIIQAIVIPQHDKEFGFRPVAFLQLDTIPPDAAQIQIDLKHTLPGYMIPKIYFQLPQENHSDKLKISRQDLSNDLVHRNKHLHSLT